jgi:kynurenine formamidase
MENTLVTNAVGDSKPSIATVRELAAQVSNWGRWGADDQIGTLNHILPDDVVEAARLVRTGERFSLSIPFDENGPQRPGSGRPNPIHLMSVDGRDFMSGAGTPHERDVRRRYLQNADDVVIMPLQSATQWDGLAHVFFEQRLYNGYSADFITSSGARRNSVTQAVDRIVGRGVLLDLPSALDQPALEPGHPIDGADLEAACRAQRVRVRRGDFVLVRTGAMKRVRERSDWGDYAGGPAPGLGLDSASWLHQREVAGVATDTWDIEARPSQTPDVAQPVHILLLTFMGLWLGEIFDLEDLALHCHANGRYEFFFVAQPLRITGAIGSPINPLAIF